MLTDANRIGVPKTAQRARPHPDRRAHHLVDRLVRRVRPPLLHKHTLEPGDKTGLRLSPHLAPSTNIHTLLDTHAEPPVTDHSDARDGEAVSYGVEAARSMPSSAGGEVAIAAQRSCRSSHVQSSHIGRRHRSKRKRAVSCVGRGTGVHRIASCVRRESGEPSKSTPYKCISDS